MEWLGRHMDEMWWLLAGVVTLQVWMWVETWSDWFIWLRLVVVPLIFADVCLMHARDPRVNIGTSVAGGWKMRPSWGIMVVISRWVFTSWGGRFVKLMSGGTLVARRFNQNSSWWIPNGDESLSCGWNPWDVFLWEKDGGKRWGKRCTNGWFVGYSRCFFHVFTYILGPADYFQSQFCFESFQSSTFTIWSWANFRAWSSLPAALTYRTCYEYLPSNGLPSILQLWWCIQRPEKYSSCSILSRHSGWALKIHGTSCQ